MEEKSIIKLNSELINDTNNNALVICSTTSICPSHLSVNQFNLKFIGLCLWYANMERILITMLFIYLSTNNKKWSLIYDFSFG